MPAQAPSFARDLERRVRQELECRLTERDVERLTIKLHAHPILKSVTAEALPPVDSLLPGPARGTVYDGLKRLLDLAGSLTLLAILAPIFLVVAALVKLKSPGPCPLQAGARRPGNDAVHDAEVPDDARERGPRRSIRSS